MITELQNEQRAEWLRMRRALWPDCSEEMHELEMAERHSGCDATVFIFKRANGGLGGFVEMSIRDRVDGSMSERVGTSKVGLSMPICAAAASAGN